jgi:hypothetical protein
MVFTNLSYGKSIMTKNGKCSVFTTPPPQHCFTEFYLLTANDRCKVNPCPAKVTTCKNTAKSYECIGKCTTTGNFLQKR